ncbi:MAG: type II toxin-antitoxin system RelE/ParE family toxin [Mojavia pulchra JT2-VF2]|uniref:Type II toxin-antitoxin system RelE/ParE family toxin n=1 Tax=Mojavia pulchra JT2-VF2 TaxID=287848 RepID=A0A951Q1V6_9NOST|nr:type II toxin-antitoxin system RelE/ParE family toxin [Mojavia pulchra JT2-VF2]
MVYKVEFTPKADREVSKLPESVQERITSEIDEKLVINPRPSGCKKLKGIKNTYRIKVGDDRVLYEVYDSKLVILIIDVDHRREVYKQNK